MYPARARCPDSKFARWAHSEQAYKPTGVLSECITRIQIHGELQPSYVPFFVHAFARGNVALLLLLSVAPSSDHGAPMLLPLVWDTEDAQRLFLEPPHMLAASFRSLSSCKYLLRVDTGIGHTTHVNLFEEQDDCAIGCSPNSGYRIAVPPRKATTILARSIPSVGIGDSLKNKLLYHVWFVSVGYLVAPPGVRMCND
ncbi:hypothetical protein PLEOSDRAFT_1084805 [Pleurotus ostreatus PC15]|uniref:Uncharacterized protein n=1 Tax=Pleurotus ostreatus (strain PC15) TaxID=1137138 RepID=A0A067NGN2_PLEO1|nr:hypothetical protein PLEOSDRAFT_1084805 [Pleurotus ostreatus PC15]